MNLLEPKINTACLGDSVKYHNSYISKNNKNGQGSSLCSWNDAQLYKYHK